MISVEAYIYPAGTTGLRLSYGRLGVGLLGSGVVVDAFQLGRDRLGGGALGSSGATRSWTTITGISSVTACYGMTTDGLIAQGDPGTLVVTLVNAGDPDMLPGLLPGTPMRLRDDGLGILWTGRLREAGLETNKSSDHFTATWIAVDTIEALASVEVKTAPAENIVARATRLASAAGLACTTGGSATPYSGQILGPITDPDTATAHLDQAATSIRAIWWAPPTTTNSIQVAWYADGEAATTTWSDISTPSYTSIDLIWSYAGTVNTLDLENIATGTKTTVANPTAVATAGPRRRALKVNLSSDAAATNVGTAYVFASAGGAGRVSAITGPKPTAIPAIGTPWNVIRRGRTYPCRLAGIRFHITPDPDQTSGEHWTTTYSLIERS